MLIWNEMKWQSKLRSNRNSSHYIECTTHNLLLRISSFTNNNDDDDDERSTSFWTNGWSSIWTRTLGNNRCTDSWSVAHNGNRCRRNDGRDNCYRWNDGQIHLITSTTTTMLQWITITATHCHIGCVDTGQRYAQTNVEKHFQNDH